MIGSTILQDYTKSRLQRLWRRRGHAAALSALLLALAGTSAHAAPGDDTFLAARDAATAGNRAKLARALDTLPKEHELQPWAQYYQLRLQLDSSSEGVPEFLARNAGSLPAERLRSDWIKALGKRAQWDDVLREFAVLQQPDQDTTCYNMQARLARQDAAALDEARPLWFSGGDLTEACRPVADALVNAQRLSADDVWERVRRMLEAKKPQQALLAGRYLPDAQEPDARTIDAITDNPMRYLARLSNAQVDGAKGSRRMRESLLYAVTRLAANDPSAAAAQMSRYEDLFPAAERGYGWGQVALAAAKRLMPEASGWFSRADQGPLNEEQYAWWIRSALRAGDWATVRRVSAKLPLTMAVLPDWIYWQARGLASAGRAAEARPLYQKIAGQPNFYGNLAADELGQPISPPPRAAPPTSAEAAEAATNPGFRRALAWFRIDQRAEGVKEWNWALRGMNDRQLLAAADLAKRNEIFDRAISAADRTVSQHDYTLRYLSPYREKVEPKARELSLDAGWVYGLMRQESRFVIQAKSTVGAQGLMQVMPATAAWVAKKIGLSSYHPRHAMDMDTNVTLGTNYMKMVLAGLDNHPVLASAAYNAGPGRAKKWRADVPLEGAIYAETIPFNETRDYVKKVMSNTVYYNALFEDRPQSLKARLGVIRPRGSGDADAESLP